MFPAGTARNDSCPTGGGPAAFRVATEEAWYDVELAGDRALLVHDREVDSTADKLTALTAAALHILDTDHPGLTAAEVNAAPEDAELRTALERLRFTPTPSRAVEYTPAARLSRRARPGAGGAGPDAEAGRRTAYASVPPALHEPGTALYEDFHVAVLAQVASGQGGQEGQRHDRCAQQDDGAPAPQQALRPAGAGRCRSSPVRRAAERHQEHGESAVEEDPVDGPPQRRELRAEQNARHQDEATLEKAKEVAADGFQR